MNSEIIVENLEKIYRVPVRDSGLIASLKSLFKPIYSDTVAVSKISFQIGKGEVVGFIGPNGAGKTTTLKMLSGLLHPTSGRVEVAGFTPFERKVEYLKKISMIMGNKTQLSWDITVLDSLYVIKEIYQVSDEDFKQRLDELVGLLEIEELLPKMARNLSLGERAKCEITAALLYQPQILFLDEPTLGMDVSVQLKLRNFFKEYNQKYNTTIIITSHYMADIESLCSRVILINKGNLVYDGALEELASQISPFKIIKIAAAEDSNPDNYAKILNCIDGERSIINQRENNYSIRVHKKDIAKFTASLIESIPLVDLTVVDAPIEAVIDQIYREGVKQCI